MAHRFVSIPLPKGATKITRNTYRSPKGYFFDKRSRLRISTKEADRRVKLSEAQKRRRKKYKLIVSTRLYCGGQTQYFEDFKIFDTYEQASENIHRETILPFNPRSAPPYPKGEDSLVWKLISENSEHCGKIPKEVNWKIVSVEQ
jgi:hypothetical protein